MEGSFEHAIGSIWTGKQGRKKGLGLIRGLQTILLFLCSNPALDCQVFDFVRKCRHAGHDLNRGLG